MISFDVPLTRASDECDASLDPGPCTGVPPACEPSTSTLVSISFLNKRMLEVVHNETREHHGQVAAARPCANGASGVSRLIKTCDLCLEGLPAAAREVGEVRRRGADFASPLWRTASA